MHEKFSFNQGARLELVEDFFEAIGEIKEDRVGCVNMVFENYEHHSFMDDAKLFGQKSIKRRSTKLYEMLVLYLIQESN